MAEQILVDRDALIEKIREEYCYNCIRFKDLDCDGCGKALSGKTASVRDRRGGRAPGRSKDQATA